MAFDWGNALRGGATGAAAGSSILPGWGTAIGGGLGLLGGFFGDDEPKETDEILDKIPGELKKYLLPYINAGKGSLGNLGEIGNEYKNLYSDPNAIISRIGAGYRESPGYQWKLKQGENAITNAEAFGGMLGTPEHQQRAGELAENLANQDFYDYLSRALELYTGGLTGRTGIEQDIYGKGATASGDLATSLANNLFARAGINYQRGSQKNASNSDMFSNILSFLKK